MAVFTHRQLRAGPGCSIPVSEVVWRFQASGKPGGQHANRTNSRVEAELDFRNVSGVDEHSRALLIDHFGATLKVVVDETRSQVQNRTKALDRIEKKLQEALKPEVVRHPTRPKKNAVERRLLKKRLRSKRKAERSHRWDTD